MSKVLVAIDGSEFAMRALGEAAALFGKDAEYVLVSVASPPSRAEAATVAPTSDVPGARTHGSSTGAMPYAPTAESVVAAKNAVYDHFRSVQRQAAANADVRVEHVIEQSKPGKRRIGRVICESAADNGADVIVVGSHGMSHAGEVLLGSVSQYVLHHADRPVLVVGPR